MPSNSSNALTLKKAQSALRIVFAVMLLSVCLYPVVLLEAQDRPQGHPGHILQQAILAAGIVTGAIVLYLRFVRVPDLFSSSEPMDPSQLAKKAWILFIVCYVLSESTALFGFALAFMRGDSRYYVPLFVAGVLLMLACYPAFPSADSR